MGRPSRRLLSSAVLSRWVSSEFELIGVIEMVLDDVLAAAGDKDELLDPGFHRLLDRILDDGLVHDRQHFLRDGLGGGQEARSHAGDGQDGFADRFGLGHG